LKTRVVEGVFEDLRYYQEILPGEVSVSWDFWKVGLLLEGKGETVSLFYDCLTPYLSRQGLLFELPVAKTYDMYELEDMWQNKAFQKGHCKWKR
jgi:hypothetical protein